MNNKVLIILLIVFLFFFSNSKSIENFNFFDVFKKHINADVNEIAKCPEKCNLNDIDIMKMLKNKDYLKKYLKKKFSDECKKCALEKGVLVNKKLLKKIRKKILKSYIKKENFSENPKLADKFFDLLRKHIDEDTKKCTSCYTQCQLKDYDITKLKEDNYLQEFLLKKMKIKKCSKCINKNNENFIESCYNAFYEPENKVIHPPKIVENKPKPKIKTIYKNLSKEELIKLKKRSIN